MDAVGNQTLRLGQDTGGDLANRQERLTPTLTQVLRVAAAARSAGLCWVSSGSSAMSLEFMGEGYEVAIECPISRTRAYLVELIKAKSTLTGGAQ